jgi:paraquat-inducible protein A
LRRAWNSRTRTLTFTLAALILYFPSNFYPLVTAEYMGQHSATTIFDGISALFTKGQYFIASLVFCTSILTPALKIIGLLFLALTVGWAGHEKLRTWIYKAIRLVDPWNMLEVYLLSILVSMAEMGEIATVHPGPGVFSFAAVVVLTLFATLSFDPKLVWDAPGATSSYEERNGDEESTG